VYQSEKVLPQVFYLLLVFDCRFAQVWLIFDTLRRFEFNSEFFLEGLDHRIGLFLLPSSQFRVRISDAGDARLPSGVSFDELA
jgi:hypothetical protein